MWELCRRLTALLPCLRTLPTTDVPIWFRVGDYVLECNERHGAVGIEDIVEDLHQPGWIMVIVPGCFFFQSMSRQIIIHDLDDAAFLFDGRTSPNLEVPSGENW